jgi:hypothetical protein
MQNIGGLFPFRSRKFGFMGWKNHHLHQVEDGSGICLLFRREPLIENLLETFACKISLCCAICIRTIPEKIEPRG